MQTTQIVSATALLIAEQKKQHIDAQSLIADRLIEILSNERNFDFPIHVNAELLGRYVEQIVISQEFPESADPSNVIFYVKVAADSGFFPFRFMTAPASAEIAALLECSAVIDEMIYEALDTAAEKNKIILEKLATRPRTAEEYATVS